MTMYFNPVRLLVIVILTYISSSWCQITGLENWDDITFESIKSFMENGQDISPRFALEGKILGGSSVNPDMVPWQVLLKAELTMEVSKQLKLIITSTSNFCGATVLSPQWIVTSAGCIDMMETVLSDENFQTASMFASFGNHDTSKDDHGEIDIPITSWYRHPDYNSSMSGLNDIALINFTEPLNFTEFIQAIALAPDNETFSGTSCSITGWGHATGGSKSTTLQKSDVPVVANKECQQVCNDSGCEIPDGIICAGGKEGGNKTCPGDLGGPLTCLGMDGKLYLAGIAIGTSCAEPRSYELFTRASAYKEWIDVMMNGEPEPSTTEPSTTEPSTTVMNTTEPSNTENPGGSLRHGPVGAVVFTLILLTYFLLY